MVLFVWFIVKVYFVKKRTVLINSTTILLKTGTNKVLKVKQATSTVPVLVLGIEIHKLRFNREM